MALLIPEYVESVAHNFTISFGLATNGSLINSTAPPAAIGILYAK